MLSCENNNRKNFFRVGLFQGYEEEEGNIIDTNHIYHLKVSRISKDEFEKRDGKNVLLDTVTSQRPNHVLLEFSSRIGEDEDITIHDFHNLKDITSKRKEKALYQDSSNNKIIPFFEESSSKDYKTKGYYKIHYEDRTIILRTKLK